MPRRNVILIIIVALLLGFILWSTASAESGVIISASHEYGHIDQQVVVEISIDHAAGTQGGQFDLLFDHNLVKPVAVNKGPFIYDEDFELMMSNLEFAEGMMRTVWLTVHGATLDSGVICTITFDLIGEGTAFLDFEGIKISPPDTYIKASIGGSIQVKPDPLIAAVEAAKAAIEALPLARDFTIEDAADVRAARNLVEIAKTKYGALDADFKNLSKLVALEEALMQLIKFGDINSDGLINIDDVILVMQQVLGLVQLEASQLAAADVNGDGVVNINDIVLIIQHILGIIESFPVEDMAPVAS